MRKYKKPQFFSCIYPRIFSYSSHPFRGKSYFVPDARESAYLDAMQRRCFYAAFPLPRFYQGLLDIDLFTMMCIYRRSRWFGLTSEKPVKANRRFGKTCSISFINGHPVVVGSKGIKIVK